MCGRFCPKQLISSVHLTATVAAFKTVASGLQIDLICALNTKWLTLYVVDLGRDWH